ncbi:MULTISPECIES: hypothetical protein [Flavobacterium]|uniref:hypothetical protein n=1 Tax=Flavobacterium TaxID=237 RepID=UPI001FCBB029|nr:MULTISPECIES: hypothetical protein [Flavobacterium]UOK42166.1 hypothetical protein LZF87_12710 [Flavobacterium enshiense]
MKSQLISRKELLKYRKKDLSKNYLHTLLKKNKTKYLSYIGLEMIIDRVESIEIENLEKYLDDL